MPDFIIFSIIGTALSETILFLLTKLNLLVGFLGFVIVEFIFIIFILYLFFYKMLGLFSARRKRELGQKISFKSLLIDTYLPIIKKDKKKWLFSLIFVNLIMFIYYWMAKSAFSDDLYVPNFINKLVENIINFLINIKIIK